MGIVLRFSRADISREIERRKALFRKAILRRFELVGFEFVKIAREKTASQGGFNDVTGNLRSSIGFAIVSHGSIKIENYEGNKPEGKAEAKQFIRELKSKFDDGYALIVVAGMGYAASVESKGKDVITGSSLIAEAMLKEAIERLKSKV